MAKDSRSYEIDRISDLHVDVTNTILTFLPLREAVRTSILSTKWRHSWVNLSKLVFDDNICQFSENDDDRLNRRHKLISTINQVLQLHDEPVLEFSLSHSALESCPEIDHIISVLSKKGVHKFSLEILKGRNHKLHSSFFSCRDLTHINLSHCIFTSPPAFEGFHRLVSLKFVNVAFSTENFDTFISSCSQLESLTLIEPPNFHCLAISAPKLNYLHFKGESEFFCFGEVPLLQSVEVAIRYVRYRDKQTCKMFEFFRCLPALEKLSVNFGLLRYFAAGVVPKKLPTSIGLETLKLSMISFDVIEEVSSVFCLISSCSSIQKIEMKIQYFNGKPYDIGVDEVVDFLKAQAYAAVVILDELREVHLTGVTGIEPELEFIKLLLAKSPALKTVRIKTKMKDNFTRLKLRGKLTRFQRASSMAKIIFGRACL